MSLLEIRDKVQRHLTDMGIEGIEVTASGGYSFRFGSARVFVEIFESGEGESMYTVVSIAAPFLHAVKPTPEFYEHVALKADEWLFGHLALFPDEEKGTCVLSFVHRLLADYLDPMELRHAVNAVAGTADEMDDELAARFGGTTFHSD